MKKRIIATSTEVGVQVNRGEKTKNLKYAKSAKYPLELVKVILWIYIDTVDDDTDMKLVPVTSPVAPTLAMVSYLFTVSPTCAKSWLQWA